MAGRRFRIPREPNIIVRRGAPADIRVYKTSLFIYKRVRVLTGTAPTSLSNMFAPASYPPYPCFSLPFRAQPKAQRTFCEHYIAVRDPRRATVARPKRHDDPAGRRKRRHNRPGWYAGRERGFRGSAPDVFEFKHKVHSVL